MREGPPDLGPAPRLWLATSPETEELRLRADVPDDLTEAVASSVADGIRVGELEALLGARATRGLTFVVRVPAIEASGSLIRSDTPEGGELLHGGLPRGFTELGFRDEDDLWPPWCVVLEAGEPVSIAFSARLSRVGVEAGVFTLPEARGRGLAALATAGWAGSPRLGNRVRFYSTDLANVSSQRVAERLGCELIGSTVEIR